MARSRLLEAILVLQAVARCATDEAGKMSPNGGRFHLYTIHFFFKQKKNEVCWNDGELERGVLRSIQILLSLDF